MANIKMKVVPKPKKGTGTVIAKKTKEPYFKDEGKDNYVCGKCGHILIADWGEGEIEGICLRCPICESYNII